MFEPFDWLDMDSWPTSPDLKESYKGRGQDLALVEDLDRVDLATVPVVVGTDNRVYSEREGLISCLAPATVRDGDIQVYVNSIRWEDFPPIQELAYLFDVFFSQYTREVLMLVGKKRDGSGWLYFVPKQKGTMALVEWDADDEEMGRFSAVAKWIGTIHVHPGNDCTPSQTDVDDWADPTKSGLHLIFGRDGSYTINGAIAERTFEVDSGSVGMWDSDSPCPRSGVAFETSGGRTLEELLTVPPPPKVYTKKNARQRWSSPTKWQPGKSVIPFELETLTPHMADPTLSISDHVEMGLECTGACPLEYNDLDRLYLVEATEGCYILTEEQLGLLRDWCEGECPMPLFRKFSLQATKG